MVADLTGLPTANASLLDEATAAAEAMTLVRRAQHEGDRTVRRRRRRAAADHRRWCAPAPRRWASRSSSPTSTDGPARGRPLRRARAVPRRLRAGSATRAPVIEAAHERGALAVVAADLLALTLLESPGELGADVAVGSSQRFGVPLFYGGPHAGFMACAPASSGTCPAGWSASPSTPRAARPTGSRCRPASSTSAARRRPPTSAPRRCCWPWSRRCTPSTTAPTGCAAIADARRTGYAAVLAAALRDAGVEVVHDAFFDTVTVRGARPRRRGRRRGRASRGLHLRPGRRRPRRHLARRETTDARDARPRCCEAFGVGDADLRRVDRRSPTACPTRCAATTDYLTHPVFNTHRSRDRDAALPAPALRPRLRARPRHDPARLVHDEAQRHHRDGADQPARVRRPAPVRARPRTPPATAELIDELEGWLAEVTGYDRVSIQPNAGSQGELAGLLAIRGYHRANGDDRPRRLPDPVVGARHQRRVRGDGRHAGRRGQGRRRRHRRPRRPARQVRRRTPTTSPRSWSPTRRRTASTRTRITELCAIVHDARRPGVRRRREPQRAARLRQAGRVRRRRVAPQPAQDVLHPARRRRPGRRPGRGARAPRAVPALAPDAPGRGEARRHRPDQRRAVRLGRHPADLVGLHPDDGRATA